LKKARSQSETGEGPGYVDDDGSGNAYAEENVQDEIIEEDQQTGEDYIDDDDDFIVDDEIDERGQVVKSGDPYILHIFALTLSAPMHQTKSCTYSTFKSNARLNAFILYVYTYNYCCFAEGIRRLIGHYDMQKA
jgi:hypothetical protein